MYHEFSLLFLLAFLTVGVAADGLAWANPCSTEEVLEALIPPKKPLGDSVGGASEAYTTEWKGRPAVFLKLRALNKDVLSTLSGDLRKSIAEMQVSDAARFLRELDEKRLEFAVNQHNAGAVEIKRYAVTEEEKAKYSVSQFLTGYDLVRRASALQFEGRPIVAAPYARVRNAEGIPVGALLEHVPGKTLLDTSLSRRLRPNQLSEIFRQLIGQLKVLHHNGLFHGDLNSTNILVDLLYPEHPVVRLIDPLYGAADYHSTSEYDFSMLRSLANEFDYRGMIPAR